MKMDLPSEQARIYELLGGFVRVDRSDEALWISDFPRRETYLAEMEKRLAALGVQCRLDEGLKMWRLDWTEEKWAEVLSSMPAEPPGYPGNEALHETYAFCRYALLHPAKSSCESLRLARAILKGTASIRQMHEQCVQYQRSGLNAAYDAGRILAAMLMEKEKEQ